MTRFIPAGIRGCLGCIPLLILLAGCENIWGWSADEDSFDHVMSDGREALRNEQYALAEEKFTAAVAMRPENSDAHYYLAKAAVLNADVDVYFLVQTLTNGTPGASAVQIFNTESSHANAIYRANYVVLQNLEPIRRGLALQGNIPRENVDLDLSIAYLLRAILRLRDTNGDGVIDGNDLPSSAFVLSELGGGFAFEGLQSLTPDQVNAMVGEAGSLLFDGSMVMADVAGDSGIDIDALNNVYATLQDDVGAYYLNNGIPGNPGEGDNDGDGVADEECFNGVDDDGDGRTDEDARVAGCS